MEVERYKGSITKVGEARVKNVNLPDWTLDYIEYPRGNMVEFRNALAGKGILIVKVTASRIYFTQ